MIAIPMTIARLSEVFAAGIDRLPETTEIRFFFAPDDDEMYGVKLMRLFEEKMGVLAFGCYTEDSMRVCTRACGISQILFDENIDRAAEAIQTQLEVWMVTESNGKFKREDQLLYLMIE